MIMLLQHVRIHAHLIVIIVNMFCCCKKMGGCFIVFYAQSETKFLSSYNETKMCAGICVVVLALNITLKKSPPQKNF